MSEPYPSRCLSEIVTPVERPTTPLPGQIYRQLGVQLWGRGAYERGELEGSQTKYRTLSRVEAGDIVVNKIWARNGSVAVVPSELSDCYVSGEFPTFTPLPDKLEPAWFHWYTKTPALWRQCDEKSRGTSGKNRIRPEKFLEIEIPLPSLDEQRRIASRIGRLNTRVEESKNLRRKASEETEALMTAALRRFFPVKGGSRQVKLEDVCETIIDNLHSTPIYADSGVPCVRSADVGWGDLHLVRALTTSEDEYKHRTVRGEPRPDDIVFVREGGGTGKAALVRQGQRFSLGQRVMMIRPDKALVLPKFFLYQLLSPNVYEDQILELTKGSASPHLNIGALKKFRFLLPSLDRQAEIVAYLGELRMKVRCLQRLQSETTAELDALMPSILFKAFRGEL